MPSPSEFVRQEESTAPVPTSTRVSVGRPPWADRIESYIPVDFPDLAQQILDSGALYAANKALHPLGFALGVQTDESGDEVIAIFLAQTNDPDGIVFDEATEVHGRRKLLKHYVGLAKKARHG